MAMARSIGPGGVFIRWRFGKEGFFEVFPLLYWLFFTWMGISINGKEPIQSDIGCFSGISTI